MRLGFTALRTGISHVRLVRRRLPVNAVFRRGRIRLNGRESILLLAPHCDDETLGAGALIHDAVKMGCTVKVVFLTNGDGFRYAANRQFKKLRVTPEQQIEFANLRQQESLQALAVLGVQAEDVIFLGFPDRGLQVLWNDAWEPERTYRSPFTGACCSPYETSFTPQVPYCGRAVVDDLRKLILEYHPSHLIVPHRRDAHGDHTATFCFAMHAMEELRSAGYNRMVTVLTYLVHRGPWPYPRGLHPRLELQPPISFAAMQERWLTFYPTSKAIVAKHRAVLHHRSQLNLQSRFLLSFVRRTELFGLYIPTQARSVLPGAVFVDGHAGEWPEGVGYLPDPVRDTITRNVEKGADVRSIAVCADAGHLFLRLEMHGRAVDEVKYTIRLASCNEDRRRMVMRLAVPDRVLIRQGQKWVASDACVCRSSGRVIELAVPRTMIGAAQRVMLGVETRYRQIMVDRTAWEVISLPPAGDPADAVLYTTASKADLLQVAAVFTRAFHDDILMVLGNEPSPEMILHLFDLLYEAEPEALLVARLNGKVVGYVLAPENLRKLWHTALSEGHLWRWFTNWLRCRYQLRFSAARTLLLDKYYFVRSTLRDPERIQHRILSVGVIPEAQRRGIATNLVQQALNRFLRLDADRVRLEVRPDNTAALRVYQKLGFQQHGSMYDTRGPWWVMDKELHDQHADAHDPNVMQS